MSNTSAIIEAVSFHLSNGEFASSITEHHHTWTLPGKNLPEERSSFSYELQVSMSHYGAGMVYRADLGSMEMVAWLHEATGRLLKRMAAKPDEGRNSAFSFEKCGTVSVEDGEPKKYNFRVGSDGRIVPVAKTTRDMVLDDL